ncbi:MAG: phasin family protein [Rhodospirillales bacterium]
MYADFFKLDKNGFPAWAADFTKIYADFDPAKMSDQVMKAMQGSPIESMDVNAVLDIQRKNMEALNKASQAAFEGAQAVAQKQAEVFKAAFDQATSAADTLGKASTPQDLAAKELDLCKTAFETSLANTKKVTDMVTKANDAAVKVINTRIAEAFEEVKGQVAKTK